MNSQRCSAKFSSFMVWDAGGGLWGTVTGGK